jgi:hypothetical protein
MAVDTKIAVITTGFLNSVDDQFPGGGVEAPGFAPGQLGAIVELTAAEAAKRSKASVGTLYGGKYQYVKFKAGTTAAATRGGQLFWSDRDNFEVTPDPPATLVDPAGIALNAVTRGQFGWIFTTGKTTVKALANTTKAAPAIGDRVALTTTANGCDALADATTFNPNGAVTLVGQWLEAPVDAGGGGLYLAVVSFPENR